MPFNTISEDKKDSGVSWNRNYYFYFKKYVQYTNNRNLLDSEGLKLDKYRIIRLNKTEFDHLQSSKFYEQKDWSKWHRYTLLIIW